MPSVPIYLGAQSALAVMRYGNVEEIWRRLRRGKCSLPGTPPSQSDIDEVHEEICNLLGHANIADADLINSLLARPLDVYISSASKRASNPVLRVHASRQGYSANMFFELKRGVYVAKPELALMQIIAGVDKIDAIMLASEACATYAARREAGFLYLNNKLKQGSKNAKRWPSPDADSAGLSDVSLIEKPNALDAFEVTTGSMDDFKYGVPPLTNLAALKTFCKRYKGMQGGAKLSSLLSWVVEGAASPMELRVAILLGISTRYGGGGLGRPAMNYKIDASLKSAKFTGSKYFKCDMYWPKYNLGVEYQSKQFHYDERARQRDNRRLNALSAQGYNIRYVAADQVTSLESASALIKLLRSEVGIRERTRIADLDARREALMKKLGLIV